MELLNNQAEPAQAPRKVAWIKRKGSAKILVGGIMCGLIILMVLVSIFWTPYNPNTSNLKLRLAPPSFSNGHILGCDNLGRDMLSRIMAGGQISLGIAFMALFGTIVIGVVFGMLSGYYGSWIDNVIDMIAEIKNSLPMMVMIIVLISIIGPSVMSMALLLAVSEWVTIYRTTRAKTKQEKNMDYIVAAKSNGASDRRIIFKYIMPNILNNVIVLATLTIGTIILAEAGLSYLGVGVARPYPSWGRMIADGQSYFGAKGWWICTFPAVFIAVFVIGINFLGDGLRAKWKME